MAIPQLKKTWLLWVFSFLLWKDFKFNYIIVFPIRFVLIQTVDYQTNEEVKGECLMLSKLSSTEENSLNNTNQSNRRCDKYNKTAVILIFSRLRYLLFTAYTYVWSLNAYNEWRIKYTYIHTYSITYTYVWIWLQTFAFAFVIYIYIYI